MARVFKYKKILTSNNQHLFSPIGSLYHQVIILCLIAPVQRMIIRILGVQHFTLLFLCFSILCFISLQFKFVQAFFKKLILNIFCTKNFQILFNYALRFENYVYNPRQSFLLGCLNAIFIASVIKPLGYINMIELNFWTVLYTFFIIHFSLRHKLLKTPPMCWEDSLKTIGLQLGVSIPNKLERNDTFLYLVPSKSIDQVIWAELQGFKTQVRSIVGRALKFPKGSRIPEPRAPKPEARAPKPDSEISPKAPKETVEGLDPLEPTAKTDSSHSGGAGLTASLIIAGSTITAGILTNNEEKINRENNRLIAEENRRSNEEIASVHAKIELKKLSIEKERIDCDLLKTIEQGLEKRLEECKTLIPKAGGKEKQDLLNEYATLKKKHDEILESIENKVKNISSSEELKVGLQSLLAKTDTEKEQVVHQVNLLGNTNKFIAENEDRFFFTVLKNILSMLV